MMATRGVIKQGLSLILFGLFVVIVMCAGLLCVALSITVLSHGLAYVAGKLFQDYSVTTFQYMLMLLIITCTAGLAIPIILLARNIQRHAESFSLLQFEDEDEEDELESDDEELMDDDEAFNAFLRTLHKCRSIDPFIIPWPKTMNDLCPCGSGLKYKDCCGKFRK